VKPRAALSGVMAVLVLVPTRPALAQERVPSCTVIVGGTPVSELRTPDMAGEVTQDLAVQVEVVPEEAASTPVIQIEELGLRFTLSRMTLVEHRWSGAIQVQSSARLAVGLYKFHVRSLGRDDCEASFYLRVVGAGPMATVGGIGSLLVLLCGLGALAAATIGSRRRRRALADMAWAEGRARVPLRVSFLGLVGGLAAGAGAIGLLQQYALVYPTGGIGLTALVLGLGVGSVLPLASDSVAVRRINRVAASA
jgi:hypothetical protein